MKKCIEGDVNALYVYEQKRIMTL